MDYTIDASGRRLGRLATEAAKILQGKHRPDFRANRVTEDRVIIQNPGKIEIGGNKAADKMYYRHTGYMGHLKERTYAEQFSRSPEKVIREAIRRMLPKNFLNARRMNQLSFTDHE
jgi:large subunit ribosomal protein L13